MSASDRRGCLKDRVRLLALFLALLLGAGIGYGERDLLALILAVLATLLLLAVGVLALAEDDALEVLEGDDYDGDVVQALAIQRVLQHRLDGEAALLVDGLRRPAPGLDGLLPLVLVAALPDAPGDVVVAHLVEDAITGHEDEVVVLVDLEVADLRLRLDYVRIAAALE